MKDSEQRRVSCEHWFAAGHDAAPLKCGTHLTNLNLMNDETDRAWMKAGLRYGSDADHALNAQERAVKTAGIDRHTAPTFGRTNL